ncbi:hypothetical protein PtB15_11B312 [Puccinia triticina]|nr:hypothetical protein PtB15_11B312 [Puccinia triticina]
MLPRYCLSLWKPYRDRSLGKPITTAPAPVPDLHQFLTWNINGVSSKFPVLKDLIANNQISVAGIQEHLRTITQYSPGLKGYNLFDRPKEEGFRGHCLYVHTTLASHEVNTDDKHIIYVKVFGLSGAKPWHILSVYMPSGNLKRRHRREIWAKISTILLPLLQGNTKPLITLMGDFNQDADTIRRILNRGSLKCLHLTLCNNPNSQSTREIKNKGGRYLDHYINSPEAARIAPQAKVDKLTTSVSDHWPVLLHHDPITVNPRTKESWNRKIITGHRLNLALSKHWDCVVTDDITTEIDLNEKATEWVEILNASGRELAMLQVPREQKSLNFDKSTKAKITRSRRTRQALNKAILTGNTQLMKRLELSLVRRAAEDKLAVKRYSKHIKLLKSKEINSLLLANEGADFHKLLQKAQGKNTSQQDNLPCFNEANELVTDPTGILNARAKYSKTLAADPTGIPRDPT